MQEAPMADVTGKVISIYNFKGGVGKTTNTHQLAWSLCRLGKNVLIVDFDSQCSLSSLCLAFQMNTVGTNGVIANNLAEEDGIVEDWEEFVTRKCYKSVSSFLDDGVFATDEAALVCSMARMNNNQRKEVRLVVGDDRIWSFDSTLSLCNHIINQPQMNSYQQILRPFNVLRQLASLHDSDIILLDLNPTFSSLNKNLLGISAFWIAPCVVDCFTLTAIRTVSRKIVEDILNLRANDVENQHFIFDQAFQRAGMSYPYCNVRYMGSFVNRYQVRNWEQDQGSQGIEFVIANLKSLCNLIELRAEHFFFEKLSDHEQLGVVSHRTGIPVHFITRALCTATGSKLDREIRIDRWRERIERAAIAVINNLEGEAADMTPKKITLGGFHLGITDQVNGALN
jgi:chromosome partitioning protein